MTYDLRAPWFALYAKMSAVFHVLIPYLVSNSICHTLLPLCSHSLSPLPNITHSTLWIQIVLVIFSSKANICWLTKSYLHRCMPNKPLISINSQVGCTTCIEIANPVITSEFQPITNTISLLLYKVKVSPTFIWALSPDKNVCTHMVLIEDRVPRWSTGSHIFFSPIIWH